MRDFILKFGKTTSVSYKILIIAIYVVIFYIVIGLSDLMDLEIGNFYLLILIALYGIVLLVVSKIFGAYRLGQYRIREGVYFHTISLLLVNFFIYVVIVLIEKRIVDFLPLIILTLMQIIAAVLWVYVGNRLYFIILNPLEMILIYGGSPVCILDKFLKNTIRYNICKATCVHDYSFDCLEKEIEGYQGVIMYGLDNNVKNQLIELCFKSNKNIFLLPNVGDIIQSKVECLDLFDTPVFFLKQAGLSVEQEILKRALDLIVIVPASIILLPFMFVTAMCIKLSDGGPVLYKQKRLTKDGKEFDVLKFRSMRVDAEKNSGARLASKNDERITPVGKVIRAIRFDELPQVINILRGDMSLVGPRPERPEIATEYTKAHPEFAYRLKVKAGLTGYAQVLGKYNTAPLDKVKLDILYIKNYSLLLDLKLIVMTFKILFMSESTEGVDDDVKLAGKLGDEL